MLVCEREYDSERVWVTDCETLIEVLWDSDREYVMVVERLVDRDADLVIEGSAERLVDCDMLSDTVVLVDSEADCVVVSSLVRDRVSVNDEEFRVRVNS